MRVAHFSTGKNKGRERWGHSLPDRGMITSACQEASSQTASWLGVCGQKKHQRICLQPYQAGICAEVVSVGWSFSCLWLLTFGVPLYTFRKVYIFRYVWYIPKHPLEEEKRTAPGACYHFQPCIFDLPGCFIFLALFVSKNKKRGVFL